MSGRGVEEEGDWTWEKDGRRKDELLAVAGLGRESAELWLQQGPQPPFGLRIPTLNFTILDTKNPLYLLDNSGDMYPFGSAVLSGNKWMRKSRFTRCARSPESSKGEFGHVSRRNSARFLTAFYELCSGSRAQRLKAALLRSTDAVPPSTVQASSASWFHAELGVQELNRHALTTQCRVPKKQPPPQASDQHAVEAGYPLMQRTLVPLATLCENCSMNRFMQLVPLPPTSLRQRQFLFANLVEQEPIMTIEGRQIARYELERWLWLRRIMRKFSAVTLKSNGPKNLGLDLLFSLVGFIPTTSATSARPSYLLSTMMKNGGSFMWSASDKAESCLSPALGT
ncbi:hypothetical protein NA56DRAFT_698314 [Hyaloscypha hepaticicola]|uniref:Uncharacterized protein n=1 Tax=Hyaloscypha hepaticicola TaxID=2082293 RepID=A0A2J6QIR0_9HELO|nr:hypothetical protein NA56DRAFT_698314 [Hyaloscypha hepaticicola]